jgi:hypothetical protein
MRASETDRALVCPASLALPRTTFTRQKTSEGGDFGRLLHHWKETGDAAPEWASDKDVKCLLKKLKQSGTRREFYWVPGEGEHEVTFALNLDTTDFEVYQGPREGADEWKLKWEPGLYLTGTADWLHWGSADTLPWVDDLKSSHWAPHPRDLKQLRSYLLVTWVADGMPTKWMGVVSVTQWERYPLGERPKRKSVELSGLDMAAHLEDLRYAVEHPEEVNVTLDVVNERGEIEEMSKCVFCSCREDLPQSSWLQNYRRWQLPWCAPGIISKVDWTKPLNK